MSIKQRLNGEPMYLMDGSAFIYRGFYANQSMQRSDGFPTSALFIVTRILLRILRNEQPRHFAFVLDGKGPHFRHDLFPLYKAQRKSTPEDLIRQLEPIRRMVHALGLRLEVSEGCEADDCIASLAARFHTARPVIMVGADKDLRQCLRSNVVLWDPAGKDEKVLTLDDFRAVTGLEPDQWPDVQAVIGDSSDNIPGIPGVGPKTAEKIFCDFPSLEAIRDGFERLPPAVRKKFDGHLEAMFLYRQLTRLDTARCLDLSAEDLWVRPINRQEAAGLLREFELTSLERELSTLVREGRVAVEDETSPAHESSTMGRAPWDMIPEGGIAVNGIADSAGESDSSAPRQLAAQSVPRSPSTSCAPRQLSLLDTPKPAQRVYCVSCTQLPAFQGAKVAVMPGENEIAIAVQGVGSDTDNREHSFEEYVYAGPVEPLIEALKKATCIVTPDVKALLHLHEAWYGIEPARWFDLGLATYLLDPEERDYGWPRLSGRWSTALDRAPGNPALLALDIAGHLARRLSGAQLLNLMQSLELPLIPVLADMEDRGVLLDAGRLSLFLTEVQSDLERLTDEVYTAAGGPFNIRSAQQLGEVLFTRLNLPAAGKTRGGQASTSQDVLEKLSGHHPVVDALLAFRKLEKLRSTYLEPLPRLMGADGRIRTSFNQLATATGRLSSSNPNLQNIPVRGLMGRRMRSCFTAPEGKVLISADYSQVELRVLAHCSQDHTLLEAFRSGVDIHARTAGLLYDIAPEAVSPDQRRNAKTINFGLIYGMGPQKLAVELGIPLGEAKSFMARYFERLSGIKQFYERVEEQAREQGYVTTLAGRRRMLPEIQSDSAQVQALARRQAINTLIQGSAADIIKLAMLGVAGDETLCDLGASLLLQVHDELLLEAPAPLAQQVGEHVARIMAEVKPGGEKLSVPLVADWGQGTDWGSAH